MNAARRKQRGRASRAQWIARGGLAAALLLLAAFVAASVAYVHRPRAWREAKREAWPRFLTTALVRTGCVIGNITDGLGITGHDVVYEYDESAPAGKVFFAGAPRRAGGIQPDDITVLNRGEFAVGWSPSLRRPVWCAYHVAAEARHPAQKRPNFMRDGEAANAPQPGDYARSHYDRGHMVPNHAIESRYGEGCRRLTFLMSNIAPQRAALNRGVWRDFERRIADFWTSRYGEIWVVVGCVPNGRGETLPGSSVEIPGAFFQLVVAQEGMDIRALAVIFERDVPRDEWASQNIVSIDELESRTGLDFLPDLPEFIQTPLEADLPTRLWPVRGVDIFKLFLLGFE